MKQISTSTTTTAGKRIGEAVDRARSGPVVLTRYGRPVAVLVDSSHFSEMMLRMDASGRLVWHEELQELLAGR